MSRGPWILAWWFDLVPDSTLTLELLVSDCGLKEQVERSGLLSLLIPFSFRREYKRKRRKEGR